MGEGPESLTVVRWTATFEDAGSAAEAPANLRGGLQDTAWSLDATSRTVRTDRALTYEPRPRPPGLLLVEGWWHNASGNASLRAALLVSTANVGAAGQEFYFFLDKPDEVRFDVWGGGTAVRMSYGNATHASGGVSGTLRPGDRPSLEVDAAPPDSRALARLRFELLGTWALDPPGRAMGS